MTAEKGRRPSRNGGPGTNSNKAERDDRRPAEDELRSLLNEYGVFLRRTVLQHCPPRLGLDPDEIEQQAVLKLWRALESETKLRHPASYLYRIVANVTTDAIRASRRKHEVPLDDPAGEPLAVVNKRSDRPGPHRRAESVDIAAVVAESLEKLNPNRRRAVALHLDGFTNSEISVMLGWSEPKVRNLVWRGAQDLRDLLRKAGVKP